MVLCHCAASCDVVSCSAMVGAAVPWIAVLCNSIYITSGPVRARVRGDGSECLTIP